MGHLAGSATCISSAVVRAFPEHAETVISAISAMPDVDVFYSENGKIVIVIEGPHTRAVGERLAGIALIDGVISANLVYEQIEVLPSGEQP
jgi:periplasmic nitrate reductase NapD